LADEIAYNAHDIDDGVRSGLLKLERLDEIPLLASFSSAAQADHPGLAGRRLLFESVRRMLSQQVFDVIAATRSALQRYGPTSETDVRRLPALVRFSDDMRHRSSELKIFLRENLYRHPQVVETTERAKQAIRELFDAYIAQPAQMPAAFASQDDAVRAVADYIAGMTDRFALKEHQRLTGRILF